MKKEPVLQAPKTLFIVFTLVLFPSITVDAVVNYKFQVNDSQNCETWLDAYGKASSGQTIKLLADYAQTTSGTKSALVIDKSLTIDLNGHTLSGNFTTKSASQTGRTCGVIAVVGKGTVVNIVNTSSTKAAITVNKTSAEGSVNKGYDCLAGISVGYDKSSNLYSKVCSNITVNIRGNIDISGYYGIAVANSVTGGTQLSTNNQIYIKDTFTGTVNGTHNAVSVAGESCYVNIQGGTFTAPTDEGCTTFSAKTTQNSGNTVSIYGGSFDAQSAGLFDANTAESHVNIHGGSFSTSCNLKDGYIAEDCDLAQNSDGTYSVIDFSKTAYYTTGNHDTQSSKTALTGSTISLTDGSYYSFVVPAKETINTITYTRTFKNDNYNAWYMPFELNASDYSDKVTFYAITGVTESDNGWSVQIEETSGKIEANTPYVVKSNSSASSTITFSLVDATLNKTENKAVTKTSNKGSIFTFTGTYTKKFVQDEQNWYALSGGKFSKQANASSGNYLNPFRFYLTITGSAASKANQGGFNLTEDNSPTGINNLNIEEVKDPVTYDLQGHRVSHPTKGIYIVNGKKMLVK